jgi:hypothetical protein
MYVCAYTRTMLPEYTVAPESNQLRYIKQQTPLTDRKSTINRDRKSFQTYLIPAVNSSLLMEGIFAPTAKKMKTALTSKGRANRLLFFFLDRNGGGDG